MCISDLCRSSTVNSPRAGGIGVRLLPASRILVPKCYACARRRGLRCFATTFYAAHQKVISHPLRRSSFPKCKQFLGLHFGFLFSRYISRYGNLKFRFLPFVVATIVAMVFFFRRICSSRPGDGEQRGQSLAALTARGRGLDCLQPQPRQPVFRRNKLRCCPRCWLFSCLGL